MADARKHVERKYVEETTYTLTLSPEEAEALTAVLAKVAGSERAPVRALVHPIFEALVGAGVDWFGRPFVRSIDGNLRARG